MAHVGHEYKLWFRRDFSLNGFTRNGPAEAYQVQTASYVSDFGPNSNALSFRAVNTDKSPGDNRKWFFEPIIADGLHWSGFVSWTSPQQELLAKGLLEVETAELGLMGSFNWANQQPTFLLQWRLWGGNITSVNFARPDWFPIFPLPRPFVSCAALPWALYP